MGVGLSLDLLYLCNDRRALDGDGFGDCEMGNVKRGTIID
jgi:hypothetical protein